MNAVDTYQQRLRDEIEAVEKEIESRSQQIEILNKRLEGLRRALELFASEHGAISELLRTAGVDGELVVQSAGAAPSALYTSKVRATKQRGPGRGKGKMRRTQTGAAPDTGPRLRRVDMIMAVLKRRSRLNVRELIAALKDQFGWEPSESSVTAHLYTNRDKFVHTKADLTNKRPVTWSLK
jgi:hypothetical protein